jgi:ectoine hydroxylase-related dioxygenase (phytanoyl-CoA dioxygenase family)
VWVALDEMVPELGPLEYVSGSHLWGDGRSGTASHFFDLLVVRVYGCLALA